MSTHFHVSGTGVTGPLAGLSGNYKWWVLVTAIFGAFVSILDTTIVNTALPHIQRAFGSDLHVASYVTTAYTLAQGVIIAASGFLANRFRTQALAECRSLLAVATPVLNEACEQIASRQCPRCGARMELRQAFTAAELLQRCPALDSS